MERPAGDEDLRGPGRRGGPGRGADPLVGNPASTYARRERRFLAERDRWADREDRVVGGRSATFSAFLLCLVGSVWAPAGYVATLLGVAAVALLTFLGLVAYHARVRRRMRWFSTLARLNREAVRRLERDWDSLPEPPAAPPPRDHPYAADLDVFGPASVWVLLGTVSTAPGRDTLRDWLLAPAAPAEIVARQEAVVELAQAIDLRDELAAGGRLADDPAPGALARFDRWCRSDDWLEGRRGLLWTARLLPFLTVLLAALHATGALGWPAWLAPLVVAVAVSRATSKSIHAEFDRAATGGTLAGYAPLFRRLVEPSFGATRLAEIRRSLGGRAAADEALSRLARWVELADVRESILRLVVQPVFLWDVHVLDGLERWKRRHGSRVEGWLDALGRADALAALGALAHAHPEWVHPEIDVEGERTVEAEDLRHPLLRPDRAVGNDVRVGPPGTLLVVSGSNMAGKSTLLRAIGVSAVLGMAGAPVAAGRLRLPPVDPWTSMRVQDSLAEGISLFMAELKRVRRVVDAARGRDRNGGDAGRPVLFLLDEPLHGTNVSDRRVAVGRVLGMLVESGAIGVVSTHDLGVVEGDGLEKAARHVHFESTLERDALDFDYRLRPGPASTSNALALLRLVGLDDRAPSG